MAEPADTAIDDAATEPADTGNEDTAEEAPEIDSAAIKARNEAKGLRERLRAAESQLEAVQGQLAAMQRAEITRIAAERLTDGEDFWLGGETDIAAMLTEDGTVDANAVRERAAALIEQRPHWGRDTPSRTRTHKPVEALRTGRDDGLCGPTWADAFGHNKP